MSDLVVRPESGPREHPPVSDLAQWMGLLAGPVTLAAQLQVSYMMTTWACMNGTVWVMHLVSALAVAASAAGILLSWRNWQAAGREWPSSEGGSTARTRFLGAVGTLLGALILLVIIALSLTIVVVGPCVRA
jgi:hypothetical protein